MANSRPDIVKKSGSEAGLSDIQHCQKGWGFFLLDKGSPAQFFYESREQAAQSRELMLMGLGSPVSASNHGALVSSKSKRTHQPMSNHYTARQWVYSVLEEGQLDTFWSRMIEFFLVGLILANVIAVALESEPSLFGRYHNSFLTFERFSVVAYTLEYFVRLWSAVEDPRIAALGPIRGRIAFALRPMMIVDFLAFAPSYMGFFVALDLRVLRIFRMFRLVKLARYSQAMQALLGVLYAERSALFASIILLLSTVCVAGELMHLAEGGVQPSKLGTLPEAMYWAIATLTTVGYGDVTPVTAIGRLIAGMTMVTGLALFALPIGIIANGFVSGLHRRRFAVTWSMLKRQSLFADFEVESLTDIMECITAAVVREHAQIMVAGEVANAFYLIVSGIALVERDGASVELGNGEFIGEETLEHASVFHTTARAVTDMHLLVFPGEELRRLVRKYPVLASRIQLASHDGEGPKTAPTPERRVQEMEAENTRLRRVLSQLALERFEKEVQA